MSDLVTFNPSRALDGNVKAVPGALAYFYDAGTTTPRTVYADEALTVPHASPLVANSTGIFSQVFVGGGGVRAIVKTAAGATLYDLDPAVKVPSGGAGAASVTFVPTPEIPKSNVQDAIAHLGNALPSSGSGLGQWLALSPVSGAALVLPAGGTLAYFAIRANTTTGVIGNIASGVGAGGSTAALGATGESWFGFTWRVAE